MSDLRSTMWAYGISFRAKLLGWSLWIVGIKVEEVCNGVWMTFDNLPLVMLRKYLENDNAFWGKVVT